MEGSHAPSFDIRGNLDLIIQMGQRLSGYDQLHGGHSSVPPEAAVLPPFRKYPGESQDGQHLLPRG